MGHMRKWPLNFIAGSSKISLGMENPREPCDSTGESRLLEACHSAGFSVTIRCIIRIHGFQHRAESIHGIEAFVAAHELTG